MSFCIVPFSGKTPEDLDKFRSQVGRVGKMLVLQTRGLTPEDDKLLRDLLNDQSERQYIEIQEECQEFLDEIKSNISKKVLKDEEIQELDASLDGLRRWFDKTRSLDMQQSSKERQKVKRDLEACQRELDAYAALVESRKKTRQRSIE